MSRKREMNQMDVVYSGWMIKSPPEKKLTGPWKIFRAKWKRRYFVLSKPAQSLPGIYHLNYYSDENCKRVRGTIDLEQCAEIIESLDSDQFQHLLAIKTTHRGKDRTYFLATETEEQMTQWVRNLCTVCGMKPDETAEPDSPQPPVREVLPSRSPQTLQPTSLPASAVGIMTKPPNNIGLSSSVTARLSTSPKSQGQSQQKATQRVNRTTPPENEQLEEYIQLETCTSGSSVRRTMRQDSVPEDFAPPPPILPSKELRDSDDVFGQTYDVPPSQDRHDVYDVPPSSFPRDDIYNVPPPRPPLNPNEMYDHPPPTHPSPSSPRSSSSDSQRVDSAYSSQGLTYDIPPSRPDGQDDVYDVPPSHPEIVSEDDSPPLRPPKPGCLLSGHTHETYTNIPTNSKVYLEKHKTMDINSVVHRANAGMARVSLDEMYSFPRPISNQEHYRNLDASDLLLDTTPPPPSVCLPVSHKYINAAKGTVVELDMYLPMDTAVGAGDVVPVPRESTSTDNEVEYTDMTAHSSFDDSFEGKQQVYDHPPSSRPAAPPPRPVKSVTSTEKQDTYSIFSTARTRSFKKKDESPRVQKKSPKPIHQSAVLQNSLNVPLPQRMDKNPDFSTSEEDDDDMGSAGVWGSIPPTPGSKEPELKYVDLDHDETTEKEPVRSPHGAPGGLTPTEYHEIDFVKTDALTKIKNEVSEERSKEIESTSKKS